MTTIPPTQGLGGLPPRYGNVRTAGVPVRGSATPHMPNGFAATGTANPKRARTSESSPDPFQRGKATGWDTNASVPLTVTLRSFKGGSMAMNGSLLYQIIFIVRDVATSSFSHVKRDTDPLTGRKFISGGDEVSGYNLQELNLLAAKRWYMNRPEYPDQVREAQDIWKHWAKLGVVRADPRDAERGYGAMEKSGMMSRRPRVVAMTIRGPVMVHNWWPRNLRQGQRLFIIAKQVLLRPDEVPEFNVSAATEYVSSSGKTLMFTGHASDMSRSVMEPGKTVKYQSKYHKELADKENANGANVEAPFIDAKPLQFIPWTHENYDYPPDEARRYTDEFGNDHLGHVIYVGRVQDIDDSRRVTAPDLIRKSLTDANAMKGLPLIRILVDDGFYC